MREIENIDYEGVAADSPFYWMSQIIMSSDSQYMTGVEQYILGSALATAPNDIRSMWVSSSHETPEVLTMGVNLEADSKIQAMIKASGLTLLAMRKTGVDIEDITLGDGRLASGMVLAKDVAYDPEVAIYDHSHSLTAQLAAIFIDMQSRMILHGSPATY